MITGPFPEQAWEDAIPAFGTRSRTRDYHAAFNGDLDSALAWAPWWHLDPEHEAYLHRHGFTPTRHDLYTKAIWAADTDNATNEAKQNAARWRKERIRRATLHLAHPHLTLADRNAIITAHLTLPEIDTLIADGPLDHDRLTLLGALA